MVHIARAVQASRGRNWYKTTVAHANQQLGLCNILLFLRLQQSTCIDWSAAYCFLPGRLSVCSFLRPLPNCEQDNLKKKNEPILLQTGRSDLRRKNI